MNIKNNIPTFSRMLECYEGEERFFVPAGRVDVRYEAIDNKFGGEYKAERQKRNTNDERGGDMSNYDEFLAQLRALQFCTVIKVLSYRKDLKAFQAKDGSWVTFDQPWFGDAFASLSPADYPAAQLQYGYYCGHANGQSGDVFYRKPTRTDKRACFMPALGALLTRRTLPVVGEVIFGNVERDGPKGARFNWWNFATRQDRNFAALLLGQETFSSGKLEQKLVINDAERPNWDLFLLAKALHFKDVGYFVDETRRNGPSPEHLGLRFTLADWLRFNVSALAPGFWQEFQCQAAS